MKLIRQLVRTKNSYGEASFAYGKVGKKAVYSACTQGVQGFMRRFNFEYPLKKAVLTLSDKPSQGSKVIYLKWCTWCQGVLMSTDGERFGQFWPGYMKELHGHILKDIPKKFYLTAKVI